jgi:signal transduction histidine kinase/ligand-binding sensor domain-containing protein/CheY-like chemotaxis protein
MHVNRSFSILVLCGWLLSSVVKAADVQPLILEHLTTTDGLPQGTVMTSLQDSQGFVWLGTEDGLVRYDGHDLFRYAYSAADPNSLPGNFIYQVVEDAGHDLWIAIKDAGIARWHRDSDTFTAYRHDPKSASSIASDSVRAVLLDSRGLVWIGTTDAGVDVLDPKSGRIQHLRHDPEQPASLSSNRIFTLALDHDGDVLVGTDSGLDHWQADTRSFLHYGAEKNAARSLLGTQVSRVLEDKTGTFWIGTFDRGLTQLDRDGRVLKTFRHDSSDPASLSDDDVRALLEDQTGHLWIGTADGLDLLDRSTGQFTHYRHDASDTESLRDSFVMSLYQDGAGLVWIGTRAGGVSRWNPRSWELGGHRPSWVGTALVTAFADAPNNKVWIALFGDGLVQFDADNGKVTPLDQIVGRKNALADARVMSLRQDHNGALWIGTMADGLKKLTAAGRLESIPVREGDPHALSAAGVMTIAESRNGLIWIGTFGGGANVLDPATGIVRQLPFGSSKPGAISAANVTAIAEDEDGNFWIGTDGGGLNLARADGTVIKAFRHDVQDRSSLPSNTVYALAVDAKNQVWIGTDGGGLATVVGSASSPDTMRFKVRSRVDGFSSDTIYGVVPDASGGLWLSGNAGLMRLDPNNGALKTYHREHGLQGEEFNTGAYFRLRDGRVCFGGPGGFNIFDPARLTENRRPPRLVLTSVEVLGVRADLGTPFWLRDHIALDHRGNIVSLDFGVLDFTSTKHNRLAYRMSGLTDHWIDLGAQRRITLTNLDAGTHTLEVSAANSDSVWSRSPLTITIHRDPAPWESRWAYAAYALAILAIVFYRLHGQRRRFRAVERSRKRLESEVLLRTKELRESNRRLAEAAQAKSDFMDRMSHELRTPMNGVVGMTELLSRTQLSATQSHLTKTIRSSAQILLQIVNDLLDLSKIRAGKVALEALPIDFGQVLEECTSLFAGAAEAKGIELIVCPPARTETVLIGDPLRVRQILMNLIGNAVKFTERGEVVVTADVRSMEGDQAIVQLAVADTGIGMDADAIGKIFEPFSQADETTTRRFGGTGLGLSICKELADVMGGHITVESKPKIGSTFYLSLPLKTGAPLAAPDSVALAGRVRILTRRTALSESLMRHMTSLGLTVISDESQREDVLVVDASTRADALKSYLEQPNLSQHPVVVIATTAEAESQDLRVRLHPKTIVLKPVHRIALHEALAAAMGASLPTSAEETGVAADSPRFNAHVLLVEDESVNAAVAQGYLTALGCTSVWVKSGTEAVSRSASERFDLIFMDLNMPGMDGFATATLIRDRGGDDHRVPIVALTAHDAINYRDRCLAAGMNDFLSKPYGLEECTRVLGRWIEKPKSAPPVVSSPLSAIDAHTVAGL